MRTSTFVFCGTIAAIVLFAGCRHSSVLDKEAFKSALNEYYHTRQVCLWDGSIKFPAQADATDDSETKRYDALTDAGLLKRMPAEKKRFLVGSKRVNNYDLSDSGRKEWTADSTQPGYGNFCLGTRKVDSILSYSPVGSDASQYSVNYHYSLNAPDWANNPEIETAFPQVGHAIAGTTASATLTKTSSGWNVEHVNP